MKLPSPTAWPRTSLALVSLVWGSAWIANAVMAEEIDPLRAGVLCFGAAWVVLGVAGLLQWQVRRHSSRPLAQVSSAIGIGSAEMSVAHRSKPLKSSPRKVQARVGMTLGCTMLALPFLLLYWASQHGAGAWAPLIYAMLSLGLGIATGRLRTAAGIAVGAMLALLNGSLPLSGEKLLWVLPISAAVALQGWSLVYTREDGEAAGSLFGLFIQFQTAMWLLIVGDLLFEPHAMASAYLLQSQTLLAALVTGVLVYAVGYWVYYRLLRVMEPAQLASSQWLQTLVAVGESAWLLRRTPGWMMLVSAAILLACAWLMLKQDRQPLTLLSWE